MNFFDVVIGKMLEDGIDIDNLSDEEFKNKYDNYYDRLTDETAQNMYEDLKKHERKIGKFYSKRTKGFVKYINYQWKEPFRIIEIMMVLIIDNFLNDRYSNSDKKDKAIVVLKGILSRGVQITDECVTLLKNGFPDAAMARWRTLYEMCIIAAFLTERNDVKLFEKYASYMMVDLYKGRKLYIETLKQSNENVDDFIFDYFNETEKNYNEVIKKYGKDFAKPYGWAMEALNSKKVTFLDIEDAVNESKYRTLYKDASQIIHAGAIVDTNYFSLDNQLHNRIDYGFALPICNVGMSLVNILDCYVKMNNSPDNFIFLRCVQKLLDDLVEVSAYTDLISYKDVIEEILDETEEMDEL